MFRKLVFAILLTELNALAVDDLSCKNYYDHNIRNLTTCILENVKACPDVPRRHGKDPYMYIIGDLKWRYLELTSSLSEDNAAKKLFQHVTSNCIPVVEYLFNQGFRLKDDQLISDIAGPIREAQLMITNHIVKLGQTDWSEPKTNYESIVPLVHKVESCQLDGIKSYVLRYPDKYIGFRKRHYDFYDDIMRQLTSDYRYLRHSRTEDDTRTTLLRHVEVNCVPVIRYLFEEGFRLSPELYAVNSLYRSVQDANIRVIEELIKLGHPLEFSIERLIYNHLYDIAILTLTQSKTNEFNNLNRIYSNEKYSRTEHDGFDSKQGAYVNKSLLTTVYYSLPGLSHFDESPEEEKRAQDEIKWKRNQVIAAGKLIRTLLNGGTDPNFLSRGDLISLLENFLGEYHAPDKPEIVELFLKKGAKVKYKLLVDQILNGYETVKDPKTGEEKKVPRYWKTNRDIREMSLFKNPDPMHKKILELLNKYASN